MLFHRAGVLTDSQEECSAWAFLNTNLHRHRVLTSKVRRTRQSKTESRQHREQFLGLLGSNRHTFTAIAEASNQVSQLSLGNGANYLSRRVLTAHFHLEQKRVNGCCTRTHVCPFLSLLPSFSLYSTFGHNFSVLLTVIFFLTDHSK